MDVIFMLTRADRTVSNALAILDEVEGLGLRHIGFKDVGADVATLRALARRIRAMGASPCLEVVSLDAGTALASARVAIDVGVDRLLGGTEIDAIRQVIAGTGIAYYPFPGRPEGHPTRLGGSAELVAEQCRSYVARGCAGVDLLAYRATEADPLELVRAARSALGERELIVAGSVDAPEKVRALAAAGVDAFTIGTAVLDGSWAPGKHGVAAQLKDVLEVARGA